MEPEEDFSQLSLEELYRLDINDRSTVPWNEATPEDRQWLNERDKKRKTLVLQYLQENKLISGKDFHHAALILQHGDSPEDYEKALDSAAKAIKLGDETAKWLYAATFDRWLLSINKPQRFGTQFKENENGEYVLAPYDPSTTDEERKEYNVPPISQAVQKFKEKYNLQ